MPPSSSPAQRSISTGSSRPAATRSARSPSDAQPGKASYSPGYTPRSGWPGAWPVAWRKPPSCWKRPPKPRGCSGNQAALAWALFCRAFVAVPAGDLKTAIAAGQESLDLATQAEPGRHRGTRRGQSSPSRCSTRASQTAPPPCSRIRRAAIRRAPRRLARLPARADDPLLARARAA